VDFLWSVAYWEAVVRIAVPLSLVALGAVISSRAGVLHVGLEGVMLIGAFFAVAGTLWTGSIWAGTAVGAAAGAGASVVFGILSMKLRMGDVIAGLVMHIGALGLTGFILRRWFPTGAFLGGNRLEPLWGRPTGTAADIVLYQHPLVYGSVIAAIGLHLFLRTRIGLRVRASGESVGVASAIGIDVIRLRLAVLTASGALMGLGGAVLGLAVLGAFSVNMVNGRGFIALACVMLGAWRPFGVVLAALFFGAADAFQFHAGVDVIGSWAQLAPYAAVLLALALLWGRNEGPRDEGRGIPSTL
jgi:simple sugar transport system permease protein